MTTSPPLLTQHPVRWRWAAALLLAAVTLLAACGGQSSGTAGNGLQPGQNDSGDSSFAMSGAYKGTAVGNSSEFVSFLTPAPELHWYGLYYLQADPTVSVYPDIYQGTLTKVTSNSASIASPALTAFQFRTHLVDSVPSHLTAGGGSIAGATATDFQITLSGITLANNQVNPHFNATSISSYSALPGTWVGTLTDNLSGANLPNRSLTFDQAGTLSSEELYPPCKLNLSLTSAPVTANPYYAARLEMPAKTGCLRTPNSATMVLTGIGFIYDSPIAAKKRLELILTDSTGSGISFRGDK